MQDLPSHGPMLQPNPHTASKGERHPPRQELFSAVQRFQRCLQSIKGLNMTKSCLSLPPLGGCSVTAEPGGWGLSPGSQTLGAGELQDHSPSNVLSTETLLDPARGGSGEPQCPGCPMGCADRVVHEPLLMPHNPPVSNMSKEPRTNPGPWSPPLPADQHGRIARNTHTFPTAEGDNSKCL